MDCALAEKYKNLTHEKEICKKLSLSYYSIQIKYRDLFESEKNIYDYKLQSGKKFIPKFSKDFVLRYLKEREEKDRVDHGIVAGYNFFNSMCTIFEQKLGEEETVVEKTDKERMLMWDKTYMDHFVFIADAIISHNIWFDEKTEKMVGKWNYGENPLNFILCLLDTIEPIKRFCEDEGSTLKYNEVLENISVIKDDEKKIKISWNDVIRNHELEKWERWKDNIKKLDEWMKIEVEEGSNFLILRW